MWGTRMGDHNLLTRRANVGLTTYPAYNLSSYHIQQDAMGKSFVSGASDPSLLAAVMVGGAVSKGIQGIGYSKFLPLAENSKVLIPLLKTGVNTVAVAGEAGAFVVTDRSLKVSFAGADSSLLHWQGEQGLQKAWKSAFVNFGAFRVVNPFTAQQNFLFRHASNSSTIVAANQITGVLGFTPTPPENLTLQFVNASVLDFQMQGSMQLLHGIFPSMALPRAEDPALWQKTISPAENRIFQEAFREILEPRLAAREESAVLDKAIPSVKAPPIPKRKILWLQFKFHLRALFRTLPLAKTLIELLQNNAASDQETNFAFSALQVLSKEASLARRNEILAELKTAFYEARDLSSMIKWMSILEHFLPHFNQTDLMEIGEYFKTNNLQSALSGKTVGNFITAIAYEITNKQFTMGQTEVGPLQTAEWLAGFMTHPKVSVGSSAAHNCLLILDSLPPLKARAFIEKYKNDFPPDATSHFYWALHAEQQLSQPLSENARTWYQQRREIAFQKLRSDLREISFPPEWRNLEAQAARINSSSDLLAFQASLRQKLLSTEAHEQNGVERTWLQLSPSARWTLLEFFVGPDQYLPLTGAQALRWRRLAREGRLRRETAIATSQRSFGDHDTVLFILGNENSVGIPEAFVNQKGHEEASQYLMLHHTHPYSPETNNIREIYPSTHHEGAESGDLHALLSQFNKIKEGEEIALSVTHMRGGSIFVIRKINNTARLDIYTGIHPSLWTERVNIQHPELQSVRSKIREWARSKGLEMHFFEIPYDRIESMNVPSLHRPEPHVQEIPGP